MKAKRDSNEKTFELRSKLQGASKESLAMWDDLTSDYLMPQDTSKIPKICSTERDSMRSVAQSYINSLHNCSQKNRKSLI